MCSEISNEGNNEAVNSVNTEQGNTAMRGGSGPVERINPHSNDGLLKNDVEHDLQYSEKGKSGVLGEISQDFGAELLMAVDAGFSQHPDGAWNFPTVKEVRKKLPKKISRAEVERGLAALVKLKLVNAEPCGCCGRTIYYRVRKTGKSMISPM